MSEVVKSVFRQRKIEKIYKIGIEYESFIHKKEQIVIADTNDKNILSDEVIGTYDVDIPILNIGEEFFLCDINKNVKIKNRMRSSDGSITYYVEDEYIETENTQQTHDECQHKLELWEYWQEKYNNLKLKYNDLELEYIKYRREYRYKNKYFN